MLPGHLPRTTVSLRASPARYTSAHADTNAAPRRSSGTSANCANSRAVLPAPSPCRPDHRADSTPGIPFSASTSSPESSATDGRPVARNASRALANAFASNVAPVSGASSNGATSSNDNSVNATPARSSTRRNSASFLRFRLATNNSVNRHSETLLSATPPVEQTHRVCASGAPSGPVLSSTFNLSIVGNAADLRLSDWPGKPQPSNARHRTGLPHYVPIKRPGWGIPRVPSGLG